MNSFGNDTDHNIIDKIITGSGIFKKKSSLKKDHGMLRIIMYEALFGEKSSPDQIEELWKRFDKINLYVLAVLNIINGFLIVIFLNFEEQSIQL